MEEASDIATSYTHTHTQPYTNAYPNNRTHTPSYTHTHAIHTHAHAAPPTTLYVGTISGIDHTVAEAKGIAEALFREKGVPFLSIEVCVCV